MYGRTGLCQAFSRGSTARREGVVSVGPKSAQTLTHDRSASPPPMPRPGPAGRRGSLACAAPPWLPDARVAAAFGNTVVSTYPDGRNQLIWLEPDGRWTGLSRTRKAPAGKWTVKADKLCMRQQTPPTLPFTASGT